MAQSLTAERETHLNMTGDNHNEWEAFSDDPYWLRRFEKLGIEPYRESGEGRFYRIDLNQFNVSIKRKTKLSKERREELAERMREIRNAA